MTESEFKRWVRKNWKGWLSSYEPRKGGTVGVADLQVVVKKRLVPIELKVGRIINHLTRKEPIIELSRVRPVQLEWHRGLQREGINTFFMIGIGDGRKPEYVIVLSSNQVAGHIAENVPIPLSDSFVTPAEFGFNHYVTKYIGGYFK